MTTKSCFTNTLQLLPQSDQGDCLIFDTLDELIPMATLFNSFMPEQFRILRPKNSQSTTLDALLDFDALVQCVHPEDFYRLKMEAGQLCSREKNYLKYRVCDIGSDGNWITSGFVVDRIYPVFSRKNIFLGAVSLTEVINHHQLVRSAPTGFLSDHLRTFQKFLGETCHHLNNLFGNILLHTDWLLQDGSIPGSVKSSDRLKSIQSSILKGGDYLKKLVNFNSEQILQRVIVDLNLLLSEATHHISTSLTTESRLPSFITLELRLAQFPIQVLADKAKLVEVFRALVLNAIEAIDPIALPGRSYQIKIESEVIILGPYKLAVFRIIDQGEGIKKDFISQLFNPFFTTKINRYGLGLASALGLIYQHGGWIQINSQPNEGTTVEVFLPVVDSNQTITLLEANNLENSTQPANDKFEEKPITILAIEDDPDILEFVTFFLEENDYTVFSAKDGTTALAIWEQHQSDISVVVTDISLPDEFNGYKLVQMLQDQKPELRAVFMSGYNQDFINEINSSKRSIFFLQKPFNSVKLIEKISECLGDS